MANLFSADGLADLGNQFADVGLGIVKAKLGGQKNDTTASTANKGVDSVARTQVEGWDWKTVAMIIGGVVLAAIVLKKALD